MKLLPISLKLFQHQIQNKFTKFTYLSLLPKHFSAKEHIEYLFWINILFIAISPKPRVGS